MTPQIILVLSILGLAMFLFITEWVRMDIVALLVLVSLALAGLVTPTEAISGFSNAAVVTVGAVLILSGGLSRTGVARLITNRMMDLVGTSDVRVVAIIMLVVGVLSGFMNNIGVASLFLPVVIAISRRKKIPPSKLMMPLAFASLLGGLVTLIGTPPNILISEALREAGLKPFGMFDYTPVGLVVMLAGTAFMVAFSRYLLPARDITQEFQEREQVDYTGLYNLDERLFILNLPPGSNLAGKNLNDSRLGAALGLNVIAILRGDQTQFAPGRNTVLNAGDRLLVEGKDDQIAGVLGQQIMELEDEGYQMENLVSPEVVLVELTVLPISPFIGQSLQEIDLRNRFGVIVLAIRRDQTVWRTNLERIPLHTGDILLAQARDDQIETLRDNPSWSLASRSPTSGPYNLEERLGMVRLPSDSPLVGKTLSDTDFGDTYSLEVMGIIHAGQIQLMPPPDQRLQAGDILMVKGRQEDLLTIEGMGSLKMDTRTPDLDELGTDGVGLVEVILSPHTTLVGRTLRELNFRTKYGLNVLAIWRDGKAHRTNLRDIPLKFGDALLLYGPGEKVVLLGNEPDFIVLDEKAQEAPRLEKAPTAILIMALVLVPVMLGLVHIAVAAIGGVVLMVLTGCLTMEEAYRSIEWKAIILIAGMLPLGIAMESTGAAQLLAHNLVNLVGGYGPLAVMAGLFILVTLAAQVMPNSAVALLLAPIALMTASSMGVSPYPFMMTVAISASASFLSPVAHPSNVMIMGPGGYKFSDYTKVGLPLTLVVLAVVLVLIPLVWPF